MDSTSRRTDDGMRRPEHSAWRLSGAARVVATFALLHTASSFSAGGSRRLAANRAMRGRTAASSSSSSSSKFLELKAEGEATIAKREAMKEAFETEAKVVQLKAEGEATIAKREAMKAAYEETLTTKAATETTEEAAAPAAEGKVTPLEGTVEDVLVEAVEELTVAEVEATEEKKQAPQEEEKKEEEEEVTEGEEEEEEEEEEEKEKEVVEEAVDVAAAEVSAPVPVPAVVQEVVVEPEMEAVGVVAEEKASTLVVAPLRVRRRDRMKGLVAKALSPLRSRQLSKEADDAAAALLDDGCEIEIEEEKIVVPEECADEGLRRRTAAMLSKLIRRTVAPKEEADDNDDDEAIDESSGVAAGVAGSVGEELEAGWAKRGSGSSLRRNVEVWRFGAAAALKVLKANKVSQSGSPLVSLGEFVCWFVCLRNNSMRRHFCVSRGLSKQYMTHSLTHSLELPQMNEWLCLLDFQLMNTTIKF